MISCLIILTREQCLIQTKRDHSNEQLFSYFLHGNVHEPHHSLHLGSLRRPSSETTFHHSSKNANTRLCISKRHNYIPTILIIASATF